MFNTAILGRSNISNITGALLSDYGGQHAIIPVWKRGLDNAVVRSGSGDYDGGDRVIGLGAYHVDGDLLLTTGWGDGFAIRRLNNDGTMTRLYYEYNALYRDTTSVYNHINSLAAHSPTSQAILTTHNVNGYSLIDYSDLKTGGTTVVNTRPASQYVFSNGVNIDRTGSYYTSGTVTAGDWMYILDYGATHYKKFPRRKWTDGTEELLAHDTHQYPGSALMDRNGYRGYLVYDEINDRVIYNYYYNGNFVVILDASTASPKVLWCDMGDAGQGDDGYEQGLFIPDPVNEPNKFVIGSSGRNILVDITPCFTGTKPTIIQADFWSDNGNEGQAFSCLFRAGTVRQSMSGDWIDRSPTDANFCPTSSDRGRNMLDGWLDFANGNIVGVYRRDSCTEDTASLGRGASLATDYSNPIFRMKSADGTPYWIKTGYGYHGHQFAVYDDSIGNKLIDNWSLEFGPFVQDNNSEVKVLYWDQAGHYVPSGCNISYFVSNNNGSTWESYAAGSTHFFSSVGNQLRVKIVANGTSYKGPYKISGRPDQLLFGSVYEGFRQADIPTKIQRFRMRGRKR